MVIARTRGVPSQSADFRCVGTTNFGVREASAFRRPSVNEYLVNGN
jgi:hypothetical protein